jgi:hypothetical protein
VTVKVPTSEAPTASCEAMAVLSSPVQFQAATRSDAARLVADFGPGHHRVKFIELGKPCAAIFTVPQGIGNLRVRKLFLRRHRQMSRADKKIQHGITLTTAELAAYYVTTWPGFQTRVFFEIIRKSFLTLLQELKEIKKLLASMRVRIPSGCFVPLEQRPSIRSCAE